MNVIEKLQDIRRSINPARAIAYLSDIQAHTRIAELFEHFFPERYQAAGFNLAESRHELSAAEKTFFELVNEHLFPIDVWSVEEEYLNCDEFNAVAITTEGYLFSQDDEFDTALEHFEFPANLFLFLIYVDLYNEPDEWWDWLMRTIKKDLHGIVLPKTAMIERSEEWVMSHTYVDFGRLADAFDTDPTLKDIGTAFRVMSQSSDNIWLDYDPYSSIDCITFDREAFEWYAEAWSEAKELLDKTDKVLEEFKNHPERLVEVIQAWDAAIVWDSKKESEDVRPAD